MKIVVIGCGNLLIEEDSIGINAVRELRKYQLPDFVTIIEAGTPGLGLLDLMEGFDKVIIVDAVVSGAPIGTIHRFTDEILPPREVVPFSLHGFNIVDAIQLGKKVQPEKLPEIVIMGIEVGQLKLNKVDVDNSIKLTIQKAIETILKIIN